MNTHARAILVPAIAALLCSGAAVAYAGGRVDTTFHAGDFDATSATIDNPYLPLPPYTTFTYHSKGPDGCEVNDTEVTGFTVWIGGVEAREVHDVVYEDDDCDGTRGFLTEDTLDWYAQDEKRNVWYFGEDTKSYCDPDQPALVCSTEGSWKAGEDGAEPGIVMLAAPAAGDFYRQEYAADARDMAKVLRTNATVKLTFDNQIDPDRYRNCVLTKEWSPLERGAIEQKINCPGVGLTTVRELHGGAVKTELYAITHLP